MSENRTPSIRLALADVRTVPADVLVLKHAGGYYGADLLVATALNYRASLGDGEVDVVPSHGAVSASMVAFLGTRILPLFRYPAIQAFGQHALQTVAERQPDAHSVLMTAHGVGYGLDEREAFLSLLTGLMSAQLPTGAALQTVIIAEVDSERARRFRTMLAEFVEEKAGPQTDGTASDSADDLLDQLANGDLSGIVVNLAEKARASHVLERNVPAIVEFSALLAQDFGVRSESKPRVFVAMPFDTRFDDEYQIAFVEATHEHGLICERMDLTSFVGDIVEEMKRKIANASVVIALLNEHNPNVFLEVGYALATNVPILFVCRTGTELPFDVRNQRTLMYDSIFSLRKALKTELTALIADGIVRLDAASRSTR